MKTTAAGVALAVCLGMTASLAATPSFGEVPKSTQKLLKDLGLTGDKLVANLDAEAQSTPAAIVEAAKKEGTISISGTIDAGDFRKMSEPFRERYPFVQIKYFSGDQNARNIKPLIAYREGRVTTDIIEGLGVNLSDYLKADALQKIGDLPNVQNIPKGIQDPDGYWVAPRLRYWCLTYNTNKLKESDLPKTWDDLLTNKKLRDGHLGLVNRPNNFMIMLWGAKGPEWSKNFMTKLFNEVRPQFRKEGTDNVIALVAAGEMDAAIPTHDQRTYQYEKERGAPISWFCPEPVPLSFSAMVLFNKSPHSNAAKLYINWFLSKEGQIAQFVADASPPIHKDLQDPRFLVYPKQVIGKTVAPRSPKLLEQEMPKVAEIWDEGWQKASANSRRR
jgi:iron(III) transport system substrate-binding protein